MTHPKKPNRYPVQFLELADRLQEGLPFSVTFDTAKEAQRFRFQFYAFRGSMRDSPEEAELYGLEGIEVKFSEDGRTVIFSDMDKGPIAQALGRALKNAE